MSGTAREQILSAIGRIPTATGDTFTVASVLTELRSRGCDLAERTIGMHSTSRMCGDAPDHDGNIDMGHDRARERVD